MALSRIEQMEAMPSKRQMRIGGGTIAYSVAGSGAPTIVLINGSGGPVEAWYRLYPAIARLGTVIAYDRPGVGGSSPPLVPQTGEAAVETLRGLLAELGAPPPYLLVGHSFGGLHANLFARRYPREVGGMVLLDATAPEDIAALKPHRGMAARAIPAIFNRLWRLDPNHEIVHEDMTVAQLAAAPAFPAIPLNVISGGKAPPSWLFSAAARALRDQHQERLTRLSPLGTRIIAPKSGHFPQMSEPELVLDAIADLCGAVARRDVAGMSA